MKSMWLPGSRFEKKTGEGRKETYHLTLLAKNETGYFNLLKLVSLAHLEGFYYKPRVDKELLKRYHEGLIALSGCLKGEVAVHAGRGEMKRAIQAAEEYRKIFGPDRFYIEIQNNGVENQALLNRAAARDRAGALPPPGRHQRLPLPPAGRMPRPMRFSSAFRPERPSRIASRMSFSSEEFYFKSPEEMADLFKDCPEAITNTRDCRAVQPGAPIRRKAHPKDPVPREKPWIAIWRSWPRKGWRIGLARYEGREGFRRPVRPISGPARRGAEDHQVDGISGLLSDRFRFYPLCQEPGDSRGSREGIGSREPGGLFA